jgi:hypothetical protein
MTDAPAFDPAQPFQVEGADAAPTFDPSQPFEAEQAQAPAQAPGADYAGQIAKVQAGNLPDWSKRRIISDLQDRQHSEQNPAPMWDPIGDMGRAASSAIEMGVSSAAKAFTPLEVRDQQRRERVAKYGPVAGTLADMGADLGSFGDAVKIPLAAMGVLASPITGLIHGTMGSILSYIPGMDKNRANDLTDLLSMGIAPATMEKGFGAAPVPSVRPPAPPPATSDELAAGSRLSKAALRDNLTADEIRAAVDKMGPNATIADVGGNVRGLAEDAANQPGVALKTAENLRTRQYGQGEAIKDAALKAAGAAHKDELIAKRTVFTQPLYEDAFAPNGGPFAMAQKGKGVTSTSYQINDPLIDDILSQPESQAGLREGLNSIRRDNVILRDANPNAPQISPVDMALKRNPDTGQWERVGKPNLRLIDATKRGFDIMLESDSPDMVHPRTGTPTNKARQIAAFRDILINRTENQLPVDPRFGTSTWAAARNQWREMSKPIEALSTIDKVVDGARDASDITGRLYGSPGARAKLAGLTQDPAKMAEFENTLQNWKTFAETNRAVTGNSRTAYRTAAREEINNGLIDAGLDAATGNPRGAATNLVKSALRKIVGPSAPVSDQLAPLMSADRQAQDRLLDLMRRRQQPGNFGPMLKAGALPAAASLNDLQQLVMRMFPSHAQPPPQQQ